LAESIKEQLGYQDVELVPSGGGAFEVKVDGGIIFSKLRLGRFPGDGEVEKGIRDLN